MPPRPPDPSELAGLRDRFPEVAARSDEDLPSMWAAVLLRLRERALVRGHGSVPGELAETLVCRWYGGRLSNQSTPDVDVETPLGRRIQVKALRYTNPKLAFGETGSGASARAVARETSA